MGKLTLAKITIVGTTEPELVLIVNQTLEHIKIRDMAAGDDSNLKIAEQGLFEDGTVSSIEYINDEQLFNDTVGHLSSLKLINTLRNRAVNHIQCAKNWIDATVNDAYIPTTRKEIIELYANELLELTKNMK